MATIKAIEGRAIHQIQSGQVIIDLCSVVKELVENSIDAGATSIDVRFKNQGLDAIEVQDNGDGISPHNYESLALKHHTSKLSTYSDLSTLQTFGFRGEALSSLCALSTFTVVTCIANDAPKGTKLEFEVSGKLKKTSLVAAQKGSTVLVENLFRNLPVRRRELERNIKREWNKVTSVLGQYACIQTGIKFSVSQQAGKGNKTTIFSTKGNQTTRENIVNIFGAKALTTLIPLDLNLELKATRDPSQTWSEQDAGRKKQIHVVGHMSRPASGDGRQTPDRQMIFVNARPCALPQVTKAFNEVYRSFNNSQSPFIFANIELDTDLYDVNVSPDKRTILLHDQNQMLENLKTALIALFESQDYTVPISQLPLQKQTSYKQLTITHGYIRSNTPEIAQTSTVESNEGRGSRVSRPAREPSTGDDLSNSKAQYPNSQNAAVSKGSMSEDQESVILDSDFVESIKETRVGPADSDPRSVMKVPVSFSQKEWQVVEKLRIEVDHARMDAEITGNPISTSRTSNRFSPQSTPPVLHLYEQWDGPGVIAEGNPIPARKYTTKPSSSIEDKLSSAKKSRQPPAEIATITIGDRIITSSIGTPLKGVRVGITPNPSSNTRKSHDLDAATPSFGSSLSQRFSAPGTVGQSASESEDFEEEIGDIEEGSSSVQPDGFSEGLEDDKSGSPELPASPQLLDYLQAVSRDLNGSDKETPEIPASSQSCEVIDNEEEIKSENFSDCEDDEEYIDEREKRIREEAKIKDMIHKAETQAEILSKEKLNRAKTILKGTRKKDLTLNLAQTIRTSTSKIRDQLKSLEQKLSFYQECRAAKSENEGIEAPQAEEKLSLTISKSDFGNMRVIGQFNLGFILACRSLGAGSHDSEPGDDNVFIIDQHASDEKYNFERLHATTIVQSQRLVVPKLLHLTALEEEIVMENQSVLQTNGFVVTIDQTGQSPVGNRCQLVSLPLSRETAFSLADLEELLALLAESPGAGSGSSSIPRPSKVRKMFAMRACRSSIMIGKTLTLKQMTKVVRHLGELDKPWNCPHGRPTMRHLCRLGLWDTHVWKEGYDANIGSIARTNWAAYVTHHKHVEPASVDNMSDDDI